jgi:predicted ribonuclease YlaK
MDNYFVPDTNVLLDSIKSLQDYKLVLLSHTLRELDKHKSSHNDELAYRARKAVRYIKDNKNKFKFDAKDYNGFELGKDYDDAYQDNNILAACVENQYGLITNDVLLQYKAEGFGLEVVDLDNDNNLNVPVESYEGYKEVYMTKEQLDDFYNNANRNTYELLVNEYLIVKDKYTDEVLDAFCWDGQYYLNIVSKNFKTDMFGQFKPMDTYQRCALDSLAKNKITMIKGKPGTGKSVIGINYAMHQLEKNKIDKIIFFVNPTLAKNAQALGFYTGSKDDKLLQSSVGNMLSSKFGSKSQVETMIQREEIVLLPFGDIRGFDTSGMNALVYIIEAQNLDKELMKLGIQRLGSDSKLIIDGDFTAQVDSRAYEGRNNGMRRVSEVFRGESYYGEVELPIIYRSEMAKKAEEM